MTIKYDYLLTIVLEIIFSPLRTRVNYHNGLYSLYYFLLQIWQRFVNLMDIANGRPSFPTDTECYGAIHDRDI
jgi:hypothetical protein